MPPDIARMETLQFVIQEKQRAVDDATKVLGDDCKDVSEPHRTALHRTALRGPTPQPHCPALSSSSLYDQFVVRPAGVCVELH